MNRVSKSLFIWFFFLLATTQYGNECRIFHRRLFLLIIFFFCSVMKIEYKWYLNIRRLRRNDYLMKEKNVNLLWFHFYYFIEFIFSWINQIIVMLRIWVLIVRNDFHGEKNTFRVKWTGWNQYLLEFNFY